MTNPVVLENRHEGTDRWAIPWPGHTLADDVTRHVKGYASATSVTAGEPIQLMVHTSSPGTVSWTIYRLGWYGGAGGRLVASGSSPAGPQAACPVDPATGRIRCSWRATISVSTSSWTSGVHVVVLTSAGFQNYIPFTVRDDGRPAAVIVLQPVTTYQAYNDYPDDKATGKSLYAYNSYGATTAGGSRAAVAVSYDRPYADHGASTLFRDAAPIARFLEARGYDVKYATSMDLHERPGLLDGARVLLSAGHDEYYSAQMFSAAEQARDAGTSLSFFGANNVYWQARVEDSGRTLVCWRDPRLDPEPETALKTTFFRTTGRPEQPLVGAMWPNVSGAGVVSTPAPWVVADGSHWIYRGTRLTTGARIANLVLGEADRRLPTFPGPAATLWDAVAGSPFTTGTGGTGLHEATVYRAPGGAWVFDAATLGFASGVGGEGTSDARAQAMATNLLTRQAGARLSVTSARAGGGDRYETAVRVSEHAFPAGSGGIVYISTGRAFPDAVAASAATRGQGPVLLVPRSSLPPVVRDELVRLQPSRVVIVGGPDAVTDDVVRAVRTAIGVTPERVAGADRYATAANLSALVFAPGVSVAYVATGTSFPDALAAAAGGAQLGGPVLFTQPTAFPAVTAAELGRLEPQRVVVAGGSSVVSDAVLAAVVGIAPATRRSGADRYATAIEIARDARGALGGGRIVLATGENFPDALVAAPAVASTGGSLVLVPAGTSLPVAVAEEIVRNDPDEILAVGGETALPQAVLDAAVALFDTAAGSSGLAARSGRPPAAASRVSPEPAAGPPPVEAEPRADATLPWLAP